jgi:hypothetical protein
MRQGRPLEVVFQELQWMTVSIKEEKKLMQEEREEGEELFEMFLVL